MIDKKVIIINGLTIGLMAWFFKNEMMATASIVLFNIGLSIREKS